MASIFTYDPDPPRVSSPWLTPTETPKPSTPQPQNGNRNGTSTPPVGQLADYGVSKLEAEPQEGPTEYKLHLLLRPRRNYSSSSTSSAVPRSQYKHQSVTPSPQNEAATILATSTQSRQIRLEQLTTQLLWRLQQSSPYHASSSNDLVLPKLPEATSTLQSPARPGKLVAGLEESRGALYEIGVSDDGTFVGLTKDEMDESLTNLRAMAASLGCTVEVVRMVVVGDCEWSEAALGSSASVLEGQVLNSSKHVLGAGKLLRHQSQLWVAEALVTPDFTSKGHLPSLDARYTTRTETPPLAQPSIAEEELTITSQTTPQLRITLTGPTTSGKSSLLGTLSTATLDNGRGKSRLSLLKHRHEIATGVTSSVAQELIGYKDANVVNYSSGNVTSWTDIHASSEKGRLVFLSDSAGHPRYRRTTVRGLIGWAPHWIVLCIAADDGENIPSTSGGTSSAQDILGTAGAGIDLAKSHLELCLKLDRPLAIVITKLDLASKTNLRVVLSKILTAIKATGRIPALIPPDQTKSIAELDLATISEDDDRKIQAIVERMSLADDLTSIVPIIMTSSAKGTGIRSMHALLRNLPIPATPTARDYVGLALNPEQPACLYHIEDIFGLPASYEPLASRNGKPSDSGVVVAGHLRFGRLSVGDIIVIGPFPGEGDNVDSPQRASEGRSPSSFGTSLSQPSTLELARIASRNVVSASVTKGEWHMAHVVSLRNLRLPVRTLEAGQVGTIGLVFDLPDQEDSGGPFERPPLSAPRIRKGMVIAIPNRHMIQTGHTLQASTGFTASFEDGDINSVIPGSVVVVYIASIRASARVVKLSPRNPTALAPNNLLTEEFDVFGLDDTVDIEEKREDEPLIFGKDGITDVQFELITSRDWIELGEMVLVMPGGGHGLYYGSERGEKGIAGLEGYVGRVVEVED